MNLQVVDVLEPLRVHDHLVRPGARVMAWQNAGGEWVVYFNGNDVFVPDGAVAAVGTTVVRKEAQQVYSSARLEEYSLAPPKTE